MADLSELFAKAQSELGNQPLAPTTPPIASDVSTSPQADASWWDRITAPTSTLGSIYDVAGAGALNVAGISDVAALPIEAIRRGGSKLMEALQPYNPFDLANIYKDDPQAVQKLEQWRKQDAEQAAERSWFPRSEQATKALADVAKTYDIPASPERQNLIAAVLPTGFESKAKLVKDAAMGVASYLAGQAGNEVAGPYAGIGASFLPLLGGKAIAKVAPVIEDTAKLGVPSHIAATVANQLEKEIPLTELTAKLREAKKNPLYGAMTTADVLGTPETAILEQGLASTARYKPKYAESYKSATEGVQISMLDEAEKEAIKNSVKSGDTTASQFSSRDILDPAEVGFKIQGVTKAARKAENATVRDLYAQVNDTIPVEKARTILAPINDLIAEKFPAKKVVTKTGNIESQISRRAPSVLTKFVEDLKKDLKAPGGMSLNDMWLYRSDALEYADTLERTQPRASVVFGDLGRVLHDKLTSLGAEGTAWKTANDAAKAFHTKYDEGFLAKTLKNKTLKPEKLVSDVLKDSTTFRQLETMIGSDSPIFDALKVQVTKELKSLTPEARATKIRNNEVVYRNLFKGDFNYLDATAGVIEKERAKAKAALPGGGSQTQPKSEAKKLIDAISAGEKPASSAIEKVQAAQKVATGSLLAGGLGSLLYAAHPVLGAVVGAGTKYGANLLQAARQDARGNALYDILMNPESAQRAAIKGQELQARRRALSTALTPDIATQRGALPILRGQSEPSESPSVIVAPQPSSQNVDDLISDLRRQLQPSSSIPGKAGKLDVSYLADKQTYVDPTLVKAVIQAESGNNPNAKSPKGAQGLMQLMPATAKDLGVKNANNPEENVDKGSKYLGTLLKRYGGDEELALAAYNWGLGRVDKGLAKLDKMGIERSWENLKDHNTIPGETLVYVPRVLKNKRKLLQA